MAAQASGRVPPSTHRPEISASARDFRFGQRFPLQVESGHQGIPNPNSIRVAGLFEAPAMMPIPRIQVSALIDIKYLDWLKNQCRSNFILRSSEAGLERGGRNSPRVLQSLD
jgi:hypothetical protein